MLAESNVSNVLPAGRYTVLEASDESRVPLAAIRARRFDSGVPRLHYDDVRVRLGRCKSSRPSSYCMPPEVPTHRADRAPHVHSFCARALYSELMG